MNVSLVYFLNVHEYAQFRACQRERERERERERGGEPIDLLTVFSLCISLCVSLFVCCLISLPLSIIDGSLILFLIVEYPAHICFSAQLKRIETNIPVRPKYTHSKHNDYILSNMKFVKQHLSPIRVPKRTHIIRWYQIKDITISFLVLMSVPSFTLLLFIAVSAFKYLLGCSMMKQANVP